MPSEKPSKTRKEFIAGAAAAAAGAVAAWAKVFPSKKAASAPAESAPEKKGHRWGMVIDLDRCTGCQACGVACSVECNMMLGTPEEASLGRVIRWLKILPETTNRDGRVRQSLKPMLCQQCDDPPCIHVCPVSATFLSPEGIVGQVYARCIGCRYCVNACPYTCKFFNWDEPQWPQDVRMPFNPDVSVRYKGIVEKCLFCHHRLQRAKDKAREENRDLRAGDYTVACQDVCPTQAIAFGDLNDPKSDVAKLATSPRARRLLEELGAEPKVIYLQEVS